MKSVYASLIFVCAMIVLPGCGGKEDNGLATDNASLDDIAKYEAELAAANAEGTYEEDAPAE